MIDAFETAVSDISSKNPDIIGFGTRVRVSSLGSELLHYLKEWQK
jgi:hypothetical protein